MTRDRDPHPCWFFFAELRLPCGNVPTPRQAITHAFAYASKGEVIVPSFPKRNDLPRPTNVHIWKPISAFKACLGGKNCHFKGFLLFRPLADMIGHERAPDRSILPSSRRSDRKFFTLTFIALGAGVRYINNRKANVIPNKLTCA